MRMDQHHIVKFHTILLARVEGEEVTQLWLSDEEDALEAIEVLRVTDKNGDTWETINFECEEARIAIEHAKDGSWPRLDQ
jgi:hypothetical protein